MDPATVELVTGIAEIILRVMAGFAAALGFLILDWMVRHEVKIRRGTA